MNLSLGAPLDDTLPPRPTEDPLTDLKFPTLPTPSPPPPCYDSDSCSEVSVSGVIADYLARPGVPAAPTTAKHRHRRLDALEAKFQEQVAANKKKTKEEAKKRAREAKAAKPRIRPTKKAKMARDLANVMVDAFSERLETEFAGDLSAQRLEAVKRSLLALNVKKIKELL
ncbi:hypothetical protein CSUB01_11991 [Colletotrichum sublineola]|uniref:Uncharacterized protein n=1 Tax=Colletotrichum sublineola TaxID=1173701 RepID=A0A066XTM7_COLSU|nr:hypothetical protein CSUB01_11991 [Colletotrichum sublineola]